MAGDNFEVVIRGRDIVGPGRPEAFEDSLKQPQPILWHCGAMFVSPVGTILVLLADATAHRIMLRDRWTLARGHTAAFAFLNWQ